MEMSSGEEDYRRVVEETTVASSWIEGTCIEIIGDLPPRRAPTHALFDFDGTLSLIREGWPEVMIPMMVEVLLATDTDETEEELSELVEAFVMELNGKQTLYQMMRLTEEMARRGGAPKEPLAYKREYHRRLMDRIESRRAALRNGEAAADYLVPGSLSMLEALQARGVQLHLASGTDGHFVLEEAELLGLDQFFGERIHGALDDPGAFSKAQVIERIRGDHAIDGESLVGFGDGFVEIQNIRETGGLAVAVASDESGRNGQPDVWKRSRLIGVGAHLVIPDFQMADQLVDFLFAPQRD